MSSSRVNRNRIQPQVNVTDTLFRVGGRTIRCHRIAKRQWEALNECDKPDVVFVDENIANSFKCAICMDIITSPVSIGCSHIFCRTCLLVYIRARLTASNQSQSQPQLQCPTCRHSFVASNIRNNNFAKRMMNGLIVKCTNHQTTEKRNVLIQQRTLDIRTHNRSSRSRRPGPPTERKCNRSRSRSRSRARDRNNSNNNEQKETKENKENNEQQTCSWTGEYNKLTDHLSECKFEIIPCATCYIPILRKEIHQHKQTCPWLILRCDECQNVYRRCALTNHECPLEVIDCVFCTNPFQRNAMKTHHKRCSRKPIKCEFYELGCTQLIVREEMKQHQTQKQSNHLSMLRNKCNELNGLEGKYTELRSDYEILKQQQEELKRNVEIIARAVLERNVRE